MVIVIVLWSNQVLDLPKRDARGDELRRERVPEVVPPNLAQPWSWLRIADIEVAASNPADARRAVARTLEGVPLYDGDFLRFVDYVRRETRVARTAPGTLTLRSQ
jgi:hypothetical protein